MGRLRLGIVLAGLVVAAVTFIPSVAGAASVTFGVPGLELCGSTPSRCDLGPIREHFIDYGNVCSDDDCFFVSAADWEKVAAGVTPTLTTLDVDYKADGQTFAGGMSAPDLWAYWKSSGIDGVYLSSETTISKSEASVENAVKAHRAVIAQDVITSSSFLGPTKVRAGTAIMIAVGYTPKGPLVVYQAKTIQMTWAQWNTQIRSVWELVVTKTAPPGTTTTTPPPTSTPNPTATLSLSPNSLTSAGGNVTLTYSSENATSCTLSSSPAIWTTASETVACNGTYVDPVAPSTTAQEWTFTFTASNSSGLSATSTQSLAEAAPKTLTAANHSANWSGYVQPSSSALVTDASGDWTVPTLNCADTPDGDNSTWVGIGGEQWATGGSSGALLQTGVTSECADGVQQNVGWWYVDPSSSDTEFNFYNFPVSAGDVMEGSVFKTTTGAWSTELTNVNTGLTAYMITGESWGVGNTGADTFTVQGSATGISYVGAYTAEWVVEDTGDGTGGALYPFPNFGSVTFTNMISSLGVAPLIENDTWAIVQDGVTLAAPSVLGSNSFTVTYTGP